MAISGRAALLVALGVVAVVLAPSTALVWGWVGLVAVVCLVDMVVAVSPRELRIERRVSGPIRADETTTSQVTVTNPGRRGAHVEIRDAWVPSLRPSPARHRVPLPG
ncbi:MAG: DUF58 domain-containing protein, partial [Propionibacterium sp.]|nr:DUF58 domain-containing protein [Propionibacterium sp.]